MSSLLRILRRPIAGSAQIEIFVGQVNGANGANERMSRIWIGQ